MNNGPVEIMSRRVELLTYMIVKQGWGRLYKLEKHLTSVVAERNQGSVLRKSTSLKHAHAFCGRNGHTDKKKTGVLHTRCQVREQLLLQLSKQQIWGN